VRSRVYVSLLSGYAGRSGSVSDFSSWHCKMRLLRANCGIGTSRLSITASVCAVVTRAMRQQGGSVWGCGAGWKLRPMLPELRRRPARESRVGSLGLSCAGTARIRSTARPADDVANAGRTHPGEPNSFRAEKPNERRSSASHVVSVQFALRAAKPCLAGAGNICSQPGGFESCSPVRVFEDVGNLFVPDLEEQMETDIDHRPTRAPDAGAARRRRGATNRPSPHMPTPG
jgi:hypothetical protein